MTQNLKPLINNIKEKWENRKQIRQQVSAGLETTKTLIEHKAREVAIQAKDHKIVTEVLRPAVSSPKADEVLSKLHETFKSPLVDRLDDLRKQFLNYTEPKAEVVNEPAQEAAADAANDVTGTATEATDAAPDETETSEDAPKAKRKKSKKTE